PASLCGVIGLKPTYGRVSRYGLVAFGSSLDQIGVFGRNASDTAAVLQVIAGRDRHDATTAEVAVPDYLRELDRDIKGQRIGVSRTLLGEGLNSEVRASIETAIDAYGDLGAEIVDVDLPHAKYATAVYYLVSTAEASSNLARYDGVRYGFRATSEAVPSTGSGRPELAEGRSPNHDLRQMYGRTRAQGFGAEVKRRIMLG